MSYHHISLLLIFMVITESFPQRVEDQLQPVYDKYKNFDYQGVIKSGDQILKTSNNLSRLDSLEIFRLQGLSYYSIADMSGALHCFIAVLHLDPDYQMQVRDNPPKVINFFEEIRRDVMKSEESGNLRKRGNSLVTTDLTDSTKEEFDYTRRNRAIGYSLLLPGTGHLKNGQSRKGWILLVSGLATLGSSVFFTIDAGKKEDAYLAATIKEEIETKYSNYNQAYKLRNTSYILYAGIWIYTQVDLLFWSKPDNQKFTLFPEYRHSGYSTLTLQFTF